MLDQFSRFLRPLARNPGFTMAAVLTLAFGIAACTSVFSVVYAVLLRPLPYPRANRLFMLWATVPQKGIAADWTSWPTIQDWRQQSKSFQDVATELRIDSATLTGQSEPEQINVGRVSANLFSLLGLRPILGRTFTVAEENRREALVVVSSRFWRTRFGSSPSIIGKQLEVDHKKATIVGVMPQTFAFPSADTQLWLPLSFVPQWSAFLSARQSDGFRAIARLKPDVRLEQAQSEMNVIGQRLETQYPNTDAGKGIVLVPLAKQFTDPHVRIILWTLFGAVALVLLIGCSNVASLSLARETVRSREFAIRTALGASRFKLIRQLLGESFVLAAVSGLLGLGITIFLQQAIPHLIPAEFAFYAQVGLNWPVLFFTVVLSAATVIFCGLIPAWQLSFVAPQNALKADSRTQAGQRSHCFMRSTIIAGEFALAVVLLSGTGLLIRSFILLQKQDLGFQPANLLVASIQLPMNAASQSKPVNTFFEHALEQIDSLPGVANAAATGSLFSNYTPNTDVIPEGSAQWSQSIQTAPSTLGIVSETFFQTVGIPLLRGRTFSKYDGPNQPTVAVINQHMADQFWPQQNPIGKRFRYGSPGAIEPEWLTVVGVVGDMNTYGPGSQAISTLYRPYRQMPWPPNMDIVVRCHANNCAALGNSVKQAIRSADQQIPQFAMQTAEGILAQISAPRRFQIWLLSAFSVAALCLAVIGIYGLLSYLVAQRTQEIGLRMALGATTHDVIRLVFASGVKLAGAGIVFGLGASFFLMRMIRHLLFETSTNDLLTMLIVSITLFTAACAASYFPARKAAQVDSLTSIRHE